MNDLLRAGKEAEVLRYVPRERAGNSDQLGAVIFGRNEAGQFVLVKDADGDECSFEHPVSMVDWNGANAYADWLSEKTGMSWRLPHELEWGKGGSRCRWSILCLGRWF